MIVVGFAAAVFFHYWMGVYRNMGYPYNTFLFRPIDRWNDFYWLFRISGDPYSVVRGFSNLPFLYRYASLFTVLPAKLGLLAHLASFVLFFACVAWHNLRTPSVLSTAMNVFAFSFLSYPFLFTIDRAAFEATVFICLYMFTILYKKHSYISALFLALAIALKVFPVVFAILLLSDRRWRELIFTAGVALALSLLSYISYPGGLGANLAGNVENLRVYAQFYVVGNEGLYFGNNLLGAVKFILMLLNPAATPNMPVFIGVMFAVLACLIVYLVAIEKRFWRKVALLVCALNLLPIVSGDYKLLHLFIPLYLFINENESKRLDWVYTALFGLLLIPKNYYRIPSLPEANISVLANPLLMLLLAGIIVVTGTRAYVAERRKAVHEGAAI